ncbi:MAG: winged helix-turn-helix transcriptional regulator, partial [Candidatus Bathyarchaeia archaeon]
MILCQLLLANSRLSYRELGEKLNLSVTAVHNRIQSLIQLGIIRKFTAKLSFVAKNGIPVLIFGTSKAVSIRDLNPKLEKNGSIYWLALGGGNVLYIGAYLKNIAELEGLVRFVKEAAQTPEPTVGITVSPVPASMQFNFDPETKLCELDY